MGSNLEYSSGSYTLTANVNNYSTYAVFESKDFSPLKKAWWTYNPFSPNGDGICDETELQFFLKSSGLVTVKIFDLHGRLVKTLLDGTQQMSGDIISVKWDGKDNYGHPLESGAYIYQVESSGLDTPKGVLNGTIVIVK